MRVSSLPHLDTLVHGRCKETVEQKNTKVESEVDVKGAWTCQKRSWTMPLAGPIAYYAQARVATDPGEAVHVTGPKLEVAHASNDSAHLQP